MPASAPVSAVALTDDERQGLREALRRPRGRYEAARAAQLSGVPQRTVYYWANHDVLVPDYIEDRPKAWSYRDLVFLRLTAWLRGHNIPLVDVVEKVQEWRRYFAAAPPGISTVIHTDGVGLSLGPLREDELTGQGAFEELVAHTVSFDVLAPVTNEHDERHRLWGPNLIRPSARTAISPWVLSGEPCLRRTRITTAGLYAMHRDRGLSADDLAELYPGVGAEAIDDGITLESRLRQAA